MGTQLWGELLINSGFGISANYDPCIFDFNVLYNRTVCIQVLFVNVRLIIIKTCYLIIKLIQRTLDKWFDNNCEFYHRKININSLIINEKSLSLISYFIPLLGIPPISEKAYFRLNTPELQHETPNKVKHTTIAVSQRLIYSSDNGNYSTRKYLL